MSEHTVTLNPCPLCGATDGYESEPSARPFLSTDMWCKKCERMFCSAEQWAKTDAMDAEWNDASAYAAELLREHDELSVKLGDLRADLADCSDQLEKTALLNHGLRRERDELRAEVDALRQDKAALIRDLEIATAPEGRK